MKNIKYYLFLLICLLTTVNVYATDETTTEATQDSTLSIGMLIFIVVMILSGTIALIMHYKNKARREEENENVKRMKDNLRFSVENSLNGPYANNNMNNNMNNNNYYNNKR